jgi:hypothetical protein
MMMKFLAPLLAILLLAAPANSQALRWEAGAQLVRLDLDTIGEGPGGAGGRISYLFNRSVGVDVEANRFFEDPSGNFGHTQILAGARAGYWIGPIGVFAKLRPGWLHLGGATAELNPGREDHFALDMGGVIMVGRGRAGMRIDAGDTVIFWGSQPFNTGLPRPVTRHNRQLSVGFVVRF